MRMLLGYKISEWALLLHILTQTRYIIAGDKEAGEESFIYPVAVEMESILVSLVKDELDVSFKLSYQDRADIVAYIKSAIDPVIKTRIVRPAFLLICSLQALYASDFKPMIELFGDKALKSFIDQAYDKLDTNKDSSNLGEIVRQTNGMIDFILEQNLPFSSKISIKKYDKLLEGIMTKHYEATGSHGMNHVLEVRDKALKLNYKYNVGCSEDEVCVAAMLHDMFSKGATRNMHHELGHDYILNNKIPGLDNPEAKERVAKAILEHRASYGGDYTSPLSELLATADRNEPDLIKILERMYRYVLEENPTMTHKDVMKNMLIHLEEKYSRNGYMKYTNMYALEYTKQTEHMHNVIDLILKKKIKISIHNFKGIIKINLR